jgi:hypothetical protein
MTRLILVAVLICLSSCAGFKVSFMAAEVSEIDERQVLTDRKIPESIVRKVSNSRRY